MLCTTYLDTVIACVFRALKSNIACRNVGAMMVNSLALETRQAYHDQVAKLSLLLLGGTWHGVGRSHPNVSIALPSSLTYVGSFCFLRGLPCDRSKIVGMWVIPYTSIFQYQIYLSLSFSFSFSLSLSLSLFSLLFT